MTQDDRNTPEGGDKLRPEHRNDKFERNEQRANQIERAEITENIDKYTDDSKKTFQKPKLSNSSGISRFGFNPSAKISPEEQAETLPRRTLQSASAHFADLTKQETLEKSQARDFEFRARFGDPASLQGQRTENVEGTKYPDQVVESNIVQNSESSFSLGLEYLEHQSSRTPLDKLGDFMHAASGRATDPENWKSWVQGEISKFQGLGNGLNDAKEETKAEVLAGWNALTNGTVAEFLSHPDAINAPAFKTVANAFDSMSKDPETTNKAMAHLGNLVTKASEGYSNLPDYEKGRIIGKVMFLMVNPEGSTEGAEAALKVAGKVATRIDKVVSETIDQALKSMRSMSPEMAKQTKEALYNYLQNKGFQSKDLEVLGEIPEGFFDNLAGAGGDWPVYNERPSPDVVQQVHKNACGAAVGEMVTNGEIKQEIFLEEFRKHYHPQLLEKTKYPSADLLWLQEELGSGWQYHFTEVEGAEAKLNEFLKGSRTWIAELREPGKTSHIVAVDGLDSEGGIMIRDPQKATRYEMKTGDFMKYWVGRSLHPVE